MKEVYGYVRVSTARQGEKGVSLIEQKDAIERYATSNGFCVSQWFEERETASKLGRGVFSQMIKALKARKASGVIVHKIDRSARNLRDWADLVDLADQGIEIHFANESIDMQVRGGRLSADIQAVVATDYIRNLREETIKGMRGRLKQGLYPWRAPVGYLDMGGGNAKEIDPIKGPLVLELFERYATGEYSLKTLLAHAKKRGLTNVHHRPLSISGLSNILNNPFYTGVIYVKRTNETFVGQHKPLISQNLFNTVQAVLQGKTVKGSGVIGHNFRRMFTCVDCSRSLIGERQKGHVYYRCHECRGVCINETQIKKTIATTMKPFKLCEHEMKEVESVIEWMKEQCSGVVRKEKKLLQLQKGSLESKLSDLTDAYLDKVIDKDLFLAKKGELVRKIQLATENLTKNTEGVSTRQESLIENLELFKTAYIFYNRALQPEKRKMLTKLTSNRYVQSKKVAIELYSPFKELCEINNSTCCAQCRDTPRREGNIPKENNLRKRLIKLVEKLNFDPETKVQSQ